MRHECGHLGMLRRAQYYNLFFLSFKNYFWLKKNGNNVMKYYFDN
jgi:hypothetical protein